MDREDWNRRYAAKELIWSAEPNRFLVEEIDALPPGRAIDLAAGEGRNAIWLAERGWRVRAVDYSKTGLDKGRRIARARNVRIDWVEADLLHYEPEAGSYDLVLLFYLQLPWESMSLVLRRAAAAVAPSGTLLLVGHDRINLDEGHGGPQDPSVLYTPREVTAELRGLQIDEAARRRRSVELEDGNATAIDCLVRASRAAGVQSPGQEVDR
jgi:SAM-dependent methyltransferase